MNLKNTILTVLVLASFAGCKKIIYYPDKPVESMTPVLLAHRGGRSAVYRENNLDGIRAALHFMKGIEVDVQISKSESIWLSHSVDLMGCKKKLGCFPESTDQEIRAVTTCDGYDISYTNLEDVFMLMKDSFPDAWISIDLKGWVPCSGNSLDIEGMMRREAELIVDLAAKYDLQDNLLIETEPGSVLIYLKKKYPYLQVYQNVYGDFERGMLICLDNGFTGLSFKTNIGDALDKDKMDLLHRKGLRVIAWNLNNADEAEVLKTYGVDFIQIDL